MAMVKLNLNPAFEDDPNQENLINEEAGPADADEDQGGIFVTKAIFKSQSEL